MCRGDDDRVLCWSLRCSRHLPFSPGNRGRDFSEVCLPMIGGRHAHHDPYRDLCSACEKST
jgi:hypothetical protein